MVARSGKRRRTASARLTATVRVLLAVVLTLFSFQCSVAYATALFEDDGAGCCAGSGHDDSDDEPDTCPCPLKCTSGCAGTLRALAPVIADIQASVALVTELLLVDGTADPPSADPFEVLHVPKPGRGVATTSPPTRVHRRARLLPRAMQLRFRGEGTRVCALSRAELEAVPVRAAIPITSFSRTIAMVAKPLFAALACLSLCLVGPACSKDTSSGSSAAASGVPSSGTGHAPANVKPGSHEDWCGEHAVPESQCTRCNPELIPAFKATKDWCPEHGLPESQCLKCNPELKIVRPPKGS